MEREVGEELAALRQDARELRARVAQLERVINGLLQDMEEMNRVLLERP